MTGFGVAFAVVAGLAGAFLAGLGWLMWRTQRGRQGRGVVTDGTVVGTRWVNSTGDPHEPAAHAHPLVEYTDSTGATRRFVHEAGGNLEPRQGRRVQVWYDPERPEESPVIHGDPLMLAGPMALMAVGGLILLLVAAVTVGVLS